MGNIEFIICVFIHLPDTTDKIVDTGETALLLWFDLFKNVVRESCAEP